MNSSDQKNYFTFFFVAVASKMEKNNLVDFSSLPILFFTSTCSTLLFYLTLQSAASLTHSYKLSLRAEQLQHTLSSCNPLSLPLSLSPSLPLVLSLALTFEAPAGKRVHDIQHQIRTAVCGVGFYFFLLKAAAHASLFSMGVPTRGRTEAEKESVVFEASFENNNAKTMAETKIRKKSDAKNATIISGSFLMRWFELL